MAGVVLFGAAERRVQGMDGLFWQLSWDEWQVIAPMERLQPGSTEINVAEFLAALITCETFAPLCSGACTLLSLDNRAAKCWFDAARCPVHPFDRCAQGVHLFLLSRSVKIRSRWIPTGENRQADVCSRRQMSMIARGHRISGLWLRKVRPKWINVLKYL